MYDFTTHRNNQYHMRVKWNIMHNNDPHSDLIPLTIADMEFLCAPEIQEALIQTIQTQPLGYTQYSPAYIDALIKWVKEHHQLTLDNDSIFLDRGVISSLLSALYAFTQPEDNIVVGSPTYPQFRAVIQASKRNLVNSPLMNSHGVYTFDFAHLESLFEDPHTTAMILCNPHNPVGRVWTPHELKTLDHLARKHNVLILSDEIHCDLTLKPHQHTHFQSINPKSIVLSSASKTFNLAGLQCSYIIINDPSMRSLWKQQKKREVDHGPNTLGIVASQTAFEMGHQWHKELLDVIQKNYETLKHGLENTLCVLSPLEATTLCWLDLNPYIKNHPTLLKRLREAHLHFHLGSTFGTEGKGFVRINIACPHDIIQEVTHRLLKIINELE